MQWTIGDVARQTGCPASTIRYYERIGLVAATHRGRNGYRYYDAAAVERLKFAHRVRALGFSTATVADLLRLADHPVAPCDDIDRLVARQIAETRDRLAQLRRLESELLNLQAACDGGHAVENCGILAALSSFA